MTQRASSLRWPAPFYRESYLDSIAVLKSGLSSRLQKARGASRSAEQLRTQNVLVVAQVALALVLLVGAGLLVRSFIALNAVKPGFTHPEQIQTIRLFIPEAQIREPERVAQMQAQYSS